MRLKRNCEIIGVLTDTKHDVVADILSISIHWNVELPKNAISKDKLNNCLGRKIGIINIDDRVYRIRRIFSNKKIGVID